MRAVLEANGMAPRSRFYGTSDFVQLLGPLKLAEYRVEMPLCPELQSMAPFSTWNEKLPTKSLEWYEAYNATKHDREGSFSRATIEVAMKSVAACVVLLQAQFGDLSIPGWPSRISDYVRISGVPKWTHEEKYVASLHGGWRSVNYPF